MVARDRRAVGAHVTPIVTLPLHVGPDRDLGSQRAWNREGGEPPRSVGPSFQIYRREREGVHKITPQAEPRELHSPAAREEPLDGDAALPLKHVLACSDGEVTRVSLRAVRRQLCRRQRTGILCYRQICKMYGGGDPRPLAYGKAAVNTAAPDLGAALETKTVTPGPGATSGEPTRSHRRGEAGVDRQEIMAPREHARLREHAGDRPRIGPHTYHAAGGVAIERRRRSTEHLDPAHAAEIDVGELSLAVGQRLRDTVEQNPHATDPECRPGAKPTDRDALVAGGVVAVQRRDPGNQGERGTERQSRTGPNDLIGRQDRDGVRGLADRTRRARHPQHDRPQRYGRVGRLSLLRRRACGAGEGARCYGRIRDRSRDTGPHWQVRSNVARTVHSSCPGVG